MSSQRFDRGRNVLRYCNIRCWLMTALGQSPPFEDCPFNVRITARSGRLPARAPRGGPAQAQCVVDEPQLPQLRRLRRKRRVPRGPRPAHRALLAPPLRDHVRGGGVVALPSPDHRRLSPRPRRARYSHPPRRPHRAGQTNAGRAPAPGRKLGLSGRRCLMRARTLRAMIVCFAPDGNGCCAGTWR